LQSEDKISFLACNPTLERQEDRIIKISEINPITLRTSALNKMNPNTFEHMILEAI
jgi:hypothetical protein